MKNRNRGEDGTLATQSVTTFIKNSKVLRGARRKGRSRRKMSQFPTREPFPFAVKTSLRNSSSCKSQSLSLFLFSRSTPAPVRIESLETERGGGFFRFPLSPRFFLPFEAPQEESRERRNSLFSSPSRGGGKKERKIVVISLMKIENGEGEGRVRGEYRREDFIRKIKKMMDVGAAQRQRGPIVEGRSRCAPIRRPGSTHVPCANRVIMYSRSAPWPVVGVKRGGPLGYTYSNRC